MTTREEDVGRAARELGHEKLEAYLASAAYNERSIRGGLAPILGPIEQVNGAFERFNGKLATGELDVGPFVVRAHGTFLAGIRTVSCGQVPEALPLARSCLETALYAFRVLSHPDRFATWLNRQDSADARRASKKLLAMREILTELEATDAALGARVGRFYEDTIDFGAHPNPYGVLVGVDTTGPEPADEARVGTTIDYFQGDTLTLRFGLTMLAGAGELALRIFGLVSPRVYAAQSIAAILDTAKHAPPL